MKEVLHYILANILGNPEALSIDQQVEEDGTIVFVLNMDDADKGLVIGKGGMNIKSIRNIISIIARRENKKVYIKITD
ncbi:MAG: KH domain-containing protein [Candidatus Dojkabacteria bacterium]|uniref:Uncharacterized protein n=2 Tax=Candidatus Dojkabacteria TaxID=74243 RepID=A0A136KF80_9BACT|nr:MAG: hypothetical protein UZ20_WS6002001037 [candidate division WS6 bacterium OLB21]MBW7953180.1 KH domain-containing protein [Candidatus Dojkabacteria bacterium]WKZ28327.1 MAG: KH domain-containing protein [Candidatus Dojkabacteria bacterium]